MKMKNVKEQDDRFNCGVYQVNYVWFLCFYVISTFVGYFMTKLSLKRVITFNQELGGG